MRVLVTGNQGYIGTILTPMLVSHGHEVVGMDAMWFQESSFFDCHEFGPTIEKDIRDVQIDDVKGFDAIIHLAGLSNDPLGDYRPNCTDEINHVASVNLAALAKKAGVGRFLYASSCSNYGSAGNDFLTENAEFRPVTPYGQSKVDSEKALSAMATEDFSPVYLRASTAYGVSPKLRFDLVVNNLTAWAFTTRQVRLKSDGKPWRPLVHVEDIARAYIAALHAPKAAVHNQAFNVGATSENYQVRDVAEMVAEVVPDSAVTFAQDAGPDKRNYRVDCSHIAKSLPEFKPQWSVRRGIQQLYKAYSEVGLTTAEFEGEKYQRIAHIKKLIKEGRLSDDLRWISRGQA